ncbi:MAG TPA: GNAT family N-acetyltransferase [Chloroflexia bacterium]|jgi:GNAT superfamily N-acetyltransferase
MAGEDHAQVIPLWMETWGYTDPEYLTRRIGADPGYIEHTLVAVAPDGEILATVHYWLFDLRDAQGRPRRVGCVSNVVTKEKARKQGHARRLMEMALDRMPQDGCEWTLLFSSEMGRSLYRQLGYSAYPLPYRRAVLSSKRLLLTGSYSVTRSDLAPQLDYWRTITPLYEAYNGDRPLTVVRDAAYWQGLHVRKLERPLKGHEVHLFVAHSPTEGRDVGYVIAYFSSDEETARHLGLDQAIILSEVGVMPGHGEAISYLLAAVVEAKAGEGVRTLSFLPPDPETDRALGLLFEPPVEELDELYMMARALDGGLSQEEVDALMAAPNAWFWHLDLF